MLDAALDRAADRPTSRRSPARSSSSPRSTTAPSRAELRGAARRDRRRCPTSITVVRADDDARRPSFAIRRAGTDVAVRFAGIPLGHEFTSLVLALLQVGGHPSTASPETASSRSQDLDGDYALRDLLLAVLPELPRRGAGAQPDERAQPAASRHVAIDGALFQDEVDARQVMAVPDRVPQRRAVRPGPHEPRADRRQARHRRAPSAAAETIAAKDPFDVLVVGGGPAGAAAADLRRPQGHPHRRRRRALRRPGARHDGASRTSSRCPTPRARSWPPRSSSTSSEYDVDVMNLQRASALVPADRAGRPASTVELESGASLQARIGRAVDRRPLARRWACPARTSTATRASPTARTATARCSRASASP